MNNFYPNFKTLHFKPFFIAICLFVFFSASSQTIPSAKQVDWTNTGAIFPVPTISKTQNILNFSGADNTGKNDNTSAINTALQSFSGTMGVLYFPTGNYLIANQISVPSNVIIKGEGCNTVFNFTNIGNDCFTVSGSANPLIALNGGYTFKSKTLTPAIISGFSVGDIIAIKETNDPVWYTTYIQRSWADDAIGQLFKITNIVGGNIYTDKEVRFASYSAGLNPMIQKINPVMNVGFENFVIVRTGVVAPTSATGDNISFNYAFNCWVKGVESIMAMATHISVAKSKNIELSGNFLHSAYNYDGTSARGYGFRIESWASDCLIENNITDSLRHAILFQVGANGNVAAYNFHYRTYRNDGICATGCICCTNAPDVVFHGHMPYANLVEGHYGKFINFDQEWGPNGPRNTVFRSRTTYSRGIEIATQAYQFFPNYPSWFNDSLNIALNEITNGGTYLVTYDASTQFLCGNNNNGTITPGPCSTNDNSLYLSTTPTWWTASTSGNWPSIGSPNIFNTNSIPAKDRYFSALSCKTVNISSTILPIFFSNFSGSTADCVAQISWDTYSETGLKNYELQTSNDGINFITVNYVTPQHNSLSNKYHIDIIQTLPLAYYRIKLNYSDKNTGFSDTIALSSKCIKGEAFVVVKPNPAINNIINFLVSSNYEGTILVGLFNSLGQKVYFDKKQIINGNNFLTISGNTFNSGLYYLCIEKMNGERIGDIQKIIVTGN